jgi:hypothetical protein
MTSILNFKDIIDSPKWRGIFLLNPGIGNNSGMFPSDLRNNEDRFPAIFGTGQIFYYKNESFITGVTLSVGVNSFFMSAQGPRGTIAAGATTTSFTLTTALSSSVGVNTLANRCDGIGFKVRVIGNSAGSSGKTEERYIVGNTSGTTPTIYLNLPLSFIPANGDRYEFLSGRLYTLGNAASAGSWKYYDVLTQTMSGNLSVVNLTAAAATNPLVGLDELLVPYDRNPGEGFKGLLTATASGAASITGQATGGDATVAANEHRNFQIRIVQDTGTPTAAGQRRNITSHTAGPSPVYTVPAWSVQPSANAIFVIENNGDRIIEWNETGTQTSTYTISTDTWDSNVTFGARPGTGVAWAVQSFGIEPDSGSNARHSFIFVGRGATLDLLDIAGAATGTWTAGIQTMGPVGTTATTSAYDPATNQGRYVYIGNLPFGGYFALTRFDLKNRVTEILPIQKGYSGPYFNLNANTRILSRALFVDGNTKMTFLYSGPYLNQSFWQLPITI